MRHLRKNEYTLTLCDWKMPGLGGQQLYERLHAENPAAASRLIFMTGDVIGERSQRFLEVHQKISLSKPFSMSEFRMAINKLAPAV